MKNIMEILKDAEIEIPADKVEAINKAVGENYKTIAEHEKKVGKLETERDTEKTRADTAEAALQKFDGIDPAQMQTELQKWKDEAQRAKDEAAAQIEERDREDAIKAGVESYSFSSEAAKSAVMAQIREKKLPLSNGQLLGLSDLLKQIQEADPNAFVDADAANNKARFTAGGKIPAPGTKLNGPQLMQLKNEHPEIDVTQYM